VLTGCRVEYLQHVLRDGEFYSYSALQDLDYGVDAPPDPAGLDFGTANARPSDLFVFQIITMCTPASRPKKVPGVDGPDEEVLRSPLSFLIQTADTTSPHGIAEGAEEVEVYCDCDPYWVTFDQLAPFQTLRSHLTKWEHRESDAEGICTRLSSPERCKVLVPITDLKCPVLRLIEQLYNLKWKGWGNAVRPRSAVDRPT
jgi:hypothetical protein